MYRKEYIIPGDIDELFEEVKENEGCQYAIIDYEYEMDNNESMECFLDELGITEEYIESNDGTRLILIHPDYTFKILLDSYGLGDFFSHAFDATQITLVDILRGEY